ncbi:hypothetical protein [Telmatospirillum sp.]|uniref:hypothetical protein n=1 Tax=Telmatospirillum sp. TaxID=2079197 RepID=UPI00284D07E0|nr:hypothetical protein [Telmatospirillum sp.]MDR3437855.1 hypothetical protein [Telmatospirillum sp.]
MTATTDKTGMRYVTVFIRGANAGFGPYAVPGGAKISVYEDPTLLLPQRVVDAIFVGHRGGLGEPDLTQPGHFSLASSVCPSDYELFLWLLHRR